ncbi:MAG TPA: hypothetical protein VGM26_10810, partial [Rhizomicrobium sp.]
RDDHVGVDIDHLHGRRDAFQDRKFFHDSRTFRLNTLERLLLIKRPVFWSIAGLQQEVRHAYFGHLRVSFGFLGVGYGRGRTGG